MSTSRASSSRPTDGTGQHAASNTKQTAPGNHYTEFSQLLETPRPKPTGGPYARVVYPTPLTRAAPPEYGAGHLDGYILDHQGHRSAPALTIHEIHGQYGGGERKQLRNKKNSQDVGAWLTQVKR